jgi:hypothetical protein
MKSLSNPSHRVAVPPVVIVVLAPAPFCQLEVCHG